MDIKNAEIFSVGTWNDIEFSQSDIDAMVHSFEQLALSGRVPLKFGHNDEQPLTDGQPALGWVQRVWSEGGKLLADFTHLPTVVYEAIKKSLYKFVSVELMQDAEQNGSSYPWVLTAVSLLGADKPAVGNLKDLAALAMSSAPGIKAARTVTFTRAGVKPNSNGDRKAMSEDNKELLEQLRLANEKIATFSTENAALKISQDKLIEDQKKEKADSIRAVITAKFEDAIKAKKITPAVRERFTKYMLPLDRAVDDVIKFSLADVDAYITENAIMTETKPTGGEPKPDEEGKSADVILLNRTKVRMSKESSTDYKHCMMQELNDDPELARAYRDLPEFRKTGGK